MSVKITVDDRKWRKLVKKIGNTMASKAVRVGVMSDGTRHISGISMVELAAIHEFGSPAAGIPERSFIRAPFEDPTVQHEQRSLLAKVASGIIEDRLSPGQAFDLLGLWGVKTIKKRITAGIDPPNAPSTLRKKTVGGKKGETPLIDTGRLINAITHKVD